MQLSLALITSVAPDAIAATDLAGQPLAVRFAPRAAKSGIRVAPQQLVALNATSDGHEIVYRWFRGPVVLVGDEYAVVDNRPYQQGFRFPISVVFIPEHLRDAVAVGVEAFYTIHENGAIVSLVAAQGHPSHPERIAADLFPAIEQLHAEEG